MDVYPGETTSLTAVWAVRTTITFIVNQGDGGPGDVDYWIQEDTSDYVTLPSSTYNPYKVGASFKGWSEYSSGSGTIYQPSGSFELDAGRPDMLYAVWDDLDYTLSFSTGKVDSTLVSGMPSEPMRDSNQDGYASFQLEGWVPTAVGYEFLGWALNNPDASTPDYTSPTASIRLDYDENNSTLTAVWKALTLYTLKFDVGEGTGTIADVTGWSGDGYCNLEVTSQAPTRENWQFLGWHDTAGQSAAKYHAGDSITLTESEGTTKTIYAVYVQDRHNHGYRLVLHPDRIRDRMYARSYRGRLAHSRQRHRVRNPRCGRRRDLPHNHHGEQGQLPVRIHADNRRRGPAAGLVNGADRRSDRVCYLSTPGGSTLRWPSSRHCSW